MKDTEFLISILKAGYPGLGKKSASLDPDFLLSMLTAGYPALRKTGDKPGRPYDDSENVTERWEFKRDEEEEPDVEREWGGMDEGNK